MSWSRMQVQSYKSRVLFKGACGAIPEDALLLEVGPHAIMRSPLRQNCAGLPYVSTMKKGEDATLTLRDSVAGLWRKGAALTWDVPEDVPGLATLPDMLQLMPVPSCCTCAEALRYAPCFDGSADVSLHDPRRWHCKRHLRITQLC